MHGFFTERGSTLND